MKYLRIYWEENVGILAGFIYTLFTSKEFLFGVLFFVSLFGSTYIIFELTDYGIHLFKEGGK